MAPTARTSPHPVRRVAAACALALGTLLALPATPAAAWTEGPCPDRTGITVVVDFIGFHDQTIVRCAPAPVESGYDALTKVGVDWTPTQRFPGFLCRIEGLPADDPCVNTPPPDAYWGYWRAEYGGSWRYSTYGPGTTSPAPGPVEGWRFSTGDDQPPRVAPPPPPAPAAAPEPTSSPSSTPAPTSTPAAPPPAAAPTAAPTTTSPTATPDSGDAGEPTDDAATTSSPTDAPQTPTTSEPSPDTTSDAPTEPTTTPTDAASPLEDQAAASAPADDDGPPVATLVGVALVALVGGGAVWADRRRRRT